MKKIVMSLIVGLICSTGAFADVGSNTSRKGVTTITKTSIEKLDKLNVRCTYILEFYDSNGKFLRAETSTANMASGSCRNFFNAMQIYYREEGYATWPKVD